LWIKKFSILQADYVTDDSKKNRHAKSLAEDMANKAKHFWLENWKKNQPNLS
jgi:hypothetical protein